jgi:hypothetical protein
MCWDDDELEDFNKVDYSFFFQLNKTTHGYRSVDRSLIT